MSAIEQVILSEFKGKAFSINNIIEATNKSFSEVSLVINRLIIANEVKKVGHGIYLLNDHRTEMFSRPSIESVVQALACKHRCPIVPSAEYAACILGQCAREISCFTYASVDFEFDGYISGYHIRIVKDERLFVSKCSYNVALILQYLKSVKDEPRFLEKVIKLKQKLTPDEIALFAEQTKGYPMWVYNVNNTFKESQS